MKLSLVLVSTDAVLDVVTRKGHTAVYSTGAARDIVESRARSEGVEPGPMLDSLAGWSNGYLLFSQAPAKTVKAESPLAVQAHMKGLHDQRDHGRKGLGGLPKATPPKAAPVKQAPAPRKKAEPKAKPAPIAEPKAAPKAPARKRAAPKASTDTHTGDAALAVPPRNLEALTAAGDPRADALWYRAGDNSTETASGRPGSFEMSAQMRGGEKMTPETKARVKAIDSVMAESKLPEPILVYRGADRLGGVRPDEAIGEGRNLVGREFSDKAFVSTTADASHASWFGGTVLRIKVPQGTSAIRMADRKGTERDQQEAEILLDRGLTYRVAAQYGRGELKGDWGGAYVLDVEVVR